MDEESFADLVGEYGLDDPDYAVGVDDSGIAFGQGSAEGEYQDIDDLIEEYGDYMRLIFGRLSAFDTAKYFIQRTRPHLHQNVVACQTLALLPISIRSSHGPAPRYLFKSVKR